MDKNKAFSLASQYAVLVAETLKPDHIILYGSHAAGTATRESDIDIAVIFNSFAGDWMDASVHLSQATRKVSLHIEPILLIRDEDELGFAEEVLRTGMVLYSHDGQPALKQTGARVMV